MISAQVQLLKADMTAKMLAGQPLFGLQDFAIAAYYNTATTTDIWRTDAPVDAILDAIDWSKYTPADAADATAIFTNRTLAIQTKQMNLQNMLIGRDSLNAAKSNIRAGLRDAVVGVPAGALGALISPGGPSGSLVLAACIRKASNSEVLLSTTTGGTTGPTTARVPLYTESAVSISPQLISDILAGLGN